MRRKHQPGRAVAALQAVGITEGLLNRMELAVFFETLNGGDLRSVSLHRKHRAGLYRQAIHQHSASAAVCRVATDVRAGKVARLAQELNQQHAWLNLTRTRLAVGADIDTDGNAFHSCRYRHTF